MAMHALHVYPHSIEMMHVQDAPFEGIDIVQLAMCSSTIAPHFQRFARVRCGQIRKDCTWKRITLYTYTH